MAFWDNKKILVTGGAGFLGSFLIEKLKKKHSRITLDVIAIEYISPEEHIVIL